MHVTNLSNVSLLSVVTELGCTSDELRRAAGEAQIEIIRVVNGFTVHEELQRNDVPRLREAYRLWLAAHPRPAPEAPKIMRIPLAPALVPVDSLLLAFRLRSITDLQPLAAEAGIEITGRMVTVADYNRLEALLETRCQKQTTGPGREHFAAVPPAVPARGSA